MQNEERAVASMTQGLYVHVPFCLRKCAYCDFYSIPAAPDAVAAYLDALARELALAPAGFLPTTLFIGGGTPTALPAADLGALLDLLRARVDVARVTEWTCEANPGTVDPDKIGILKQAGVNRISLGAQSFDAQTLRLLGRIHAPDQVATAMQDLRAAGFGNINLDLIYGVPGRSLSQWGIDLAAALDLAPEHLAAYGLTLEPGTPLAQACGQGQVAEAPDDDFCDQYEELRRLAAQRGFHHYELSNFSRPGFECRHNLIYWEGAPYLGFGPAAHSYWAGRRFGNVRDLAAYCRGLAAGTPVREYDDDLDPAARARELLILGLRKPDGVDRAAFQALTGFDYQDLVGPAIRRLVAQGGLLDEGDRLRLAPSAYLTSNAVFRELV